VARGGSPGCGLGERARCVDDGAWLLQASLEVGRAGELRRLGEGSLCSLASAGSLAREAKAFFEEVATSEELARRLSQTWVEACAGRGTTDARLVNKLRMVVHDFAASEAGRRQAEKREVEEREMEDTNCKALFADFESLGLSKSTRVLDYGCGPGDMLVSYAKCGLGSHNVGIDVQDVRANDGENAFKFVQLEMPYPASLEKHVASERLDGQFGFVTADRVFHHIGNEQDIRGITRQLGKALKPCGKLLIVDWDNSGNPDLAPLFDLTHTFWDTLCLPYRKGRAETCVGEVSDEDLHKMWEGANTIYLSRERYRQIIEEEAGVSLRPQKHQSAQDEDAEKQNHTAVKGWYEVLHPFVDIYEKAC